MFSHVMGALLPVCVCVSLTASCVHRMTRWKPLQRVHAGVDCAKLTLGVASCAAALRLQRGGLRQGVWPQGPSATTPFPACREAEAC